jgi:radical SAM protein with 4Fe4S-binding SPASM domain
MRVTKIREINSMRKLVEVAWEITDRCNLDCIICYNPRKRTDLKKTKIINILDELLELGVEKIKYGGGDPPLRKDFPQILEETIKRKFSTTFSTNGYAINEEIVNKIADTGLRKVQISVDGNKQIHNYIRQNSQSYQRAINAIMLFKNKNFDISVATTLVKPNIKCLDDIYEMCNFLEIKRWRVMKYIPTKEIELMPSVHEYNAAQEWLESKMHISSVDIFVEREFDKIGNKKDAHDFQCFGGKTTMSIKSNGEVTPCSYFPDLIIGDLNKNSVREIWNKKSMNEFQKIDFGNKLCEYYKNCAGGCKAAAHYTELHLHKKIMCDPYCGISKS